MTPASGKSARSPWLTAWFSPRQTIEQLTAARPTYLVLTLAILGTIASLYNQITVIDGGASLLDFQLTAGLVVASIPLGVFWLYLEGVLLSWIGARLGGAASALHMRAVFAWSMPPTILGLILILVIGIINARSAAPVISPDVVPLVVAAASFWSLALFLLMLGRVEHFGFGRTILMYALNVLVALAVALVIRSFLYQPFSVPSGSMRPTLLVGDYFFASKFAYGYNRFSLPDSRFLPVARVFASEPAPGDVVVFRIEKDTAVDEKDKAVDYVKRVVGLPGDRVQMKGGSLYINDAPVKRERLAAADGGGCGSDSRDVKRWRETLPNGVSYETLDCVENSSLDNTTVFTVPAGHVFVLGDNRDNSTDSRVSTVGFIPFDNLIGRVSLIFFSRDGDGARGHIRAERIGQIVR